MEVSIGSGAADCRAAKMGPRAWTLVKLCTVCGLPGAPALSGAALVRKVAPTICRSTLRLDASLQSTVGAAREEAARGYAELLFRLAADGHPGVFPACERMFHDGVRVRDLPFHVRTMLEGKLPPEISAFLGDEAFISGQAGDTPGASLQDYPSPGVWVQPAGAVPEVGPDEVARGWQLAERSGGPVLFRAIGAKWPAVTEWRRPQSLAEQLPYAMVRIAHGPAVAFCRESHPDVRAGLVEPPSRVVAMPFAQFCRRLRKGRGGLEPLLPPPADASPHSGGQGEAVYMQALAPDGLMADANIEELLGPRNAPGASRPPVMGRLWVCAPGVWSPAHFDDVDSLLWQAVGAKRMILFPRDATPLLDPYPAGHALERRLRVPLTGERPTDEKFAKRIEAHALSADLRPGDAIFFPAGWAHHTEAVRLECSASVAGDGEAEAPPFWDGISISLGLRI